MQSTSKKRIIAPLLLAILTLAGCTGQKQTALKLFGTLDASVEFDGEYFIVTNLGSFTWSDSVFSVNGAPRTITAREYMLRTREAIIPRAPNNYNAARFRTSVYTEGTHRGFFSSFMERSIFSCRYAQGKHLDCKEVAPRSFYINIYDPDGREFDWWGDFPSDL